MLSIHQKTCRKFFFEKFLKVRASPRFADNFRQVFWCMHQSQKTFRKFHAIWTRSNFQKLFETCFSISYTRKLAEIYCRNIFRQYISASFLVYDIEKQVSKSFWKFERVQIAWNFRKVFWLWCIHQKTCRKLSANLGDARTFKNFSKKNFRQVFWCMDNIILSL